MYLKPTAMGLTADQTDMQFLHPVTAHGDADTRHRWVLSFVQVLNVSDTVTGWRGEVAATSR